MIFSRLAALVLIVFFSERCNAEPELRPSSEMQDFCYNFPTESFNRLNCVKCTFGQSPYLVLNVGDRAYDFTLYTLDGKPWTLSNALKEGKPVSLIWGMYTCPAFEGMGTSAPWDQCAFWDEAALVSEYKDRITFVHLVGPEPHPSAPYVNFDSGYIRPSYWSTVIQSYTYNLRLEMTKLIQPFIHPDSVLLADLLPDNPYVPGVSQPVWCSFGQGARTATVIDTDGIVKYTQEWFHAGDMKEALDQIINLNVEVNFDALKSRTAQLKERL